MRLLRILSRNFQDAGKSVFRNFSLSLASISCITITLLIVSISLVLSYNVNNITKIMKSDFTVVVFLDNNTTNDSLEVIKTSVGSLSNVEEYTYQSKKQIADNMKKSSDVFNTIIGSWKENENPLQDTLLIKVKDVEIIKETASELKKISGVSLVRYGEGIVENLLSVFDVVEKGLIVVVISLVLVTAFLISNTIKITIFSRRKEIEIMRLVGASNINIKLPFIIEGLILGILGSLAPIIIVIYGYTTLYSYFNGKLFSSFFQLVAPEPFVYAVASLLILIGAIVGMFGSYRAVKKHLKV